MLIQKNSDLTDFIRKFFLMVDYDAYNLPKNYMDNKVLCDCAFFNHSCKSNCMFMAGTGDNDSTIAIRDIEPGKIFY
jgi:hypothetical protein